MFRPDVLMPHVMHFDLSVVSHLAHEQVMHSVADERVNVEVAMRKMVSGGF